MTAAEMARVVETERGKKTAAAEMTGVTMAARRRRTETGPDGASGETRPIGQTVGTATRKTAGAVTGIGAEADRHAGLETEVQRDGNGY